MGHKSSKTTPRELKLIGFVCVFGSTSKNLKRRKMRVSTCYELSLICISEIEVHTSWTVLGLGSSILGVYLDWVWVYLQCTRIGFEYT